MARRRAVSRHPTAAHGQLHPPGAINTSCLPARLTSPQAAARRRGPHPRVPGAGTRGQACPPPPTTRHLPGCCESFAKKKGFLQNSAVFCKIAGGSQFEGDFFNTGKAYKIWGGCKKRSGGGRFCSVTHGRLTPRRNPNNLPPPPHPTPRVPGVPAPRCAVRCGFRGG